MAGPGVKSTEASSFGPNVGPNNVSADFGPNCSPFSTVSSYIDSYGYPVYSSMPIYGDPFAIYQNCISPTNYNCGNIGFYGNNGYGYNFNPYGYSYNACSLSCPGASTQYINGAQVCVGPPAQILFSPNPTSVTCGGASNFEVAVLDGNGFRVLNGTDVNFTTTLGYISSTDGTKNGLADTSLTIPPKQAGQALLTATAGGATAQKLVTVTC